MRVNVVLFRMYCLTLSSYCLTASLHSQHCAHLPGYDGAVASCSEFICMHSVSSVVLLLAFACGIDGSYLVESYHSNAHVCTALFDYVACEQHLVAVHFDALGWGDKHHLSSRERFHEHLAAVAHRLGKSQNGVHIALGGERLTVGKHLPGRLVVCLRTLVNHASLVPAAMIIRCGAGCCPLACACFRRTI